VRRNVGVLDPSSSSTLGGAAERKLEVLDRFLDRGLRAAGRLPGDAATTFEYDGRVASERSDRTARLETKIDKVAADVSKQVVEIQQLRSEIHQLRLDFEAAEQRLTRAISVEIAHAPGVIEERFAQYFGLLDEKYGGAVGELRSDLDAHRFDRSIHVPRE
jgi:outer membrane murein-binding lipoprotein Lpp